MNTSKLFLPLGALALGALTATAAPFQPAQVSNEANWYIHADLDTLRTTQVGATLMEAVRQKHGRQLKAVKRMFSLNPFTDLHGVTLYGSGKKDEAVVLIHATCDRGHLEDLIGASDGYKTSKHHDNTIHTWTDDKEKVQNGAFHGEDLVIISEHKKLVSHALDVLDMRIDGMDSKPAKSAFMFGLVNLEGIDIKGDEAKLFEKAKTLQGRLFEQGDRLHAELVIEAAALWAVAREKLKPDEFSALWFFYREDLPVKELAKVLRKTTSHTKVILHRARTRLRDHLEPDTCRPAPATPATIHTTQCTPTILSRNPPRTFSAPRSRTPPHAPVSRRASSPASATPPHRPPSPGDSCSAHRARSCCSPPSSSPLLNPKAPPTITEAPTASERPVLELTELPNPLEKEAVALRTNATRAGRFLINCLPSLPEGADQL